MNNTAFKQTTEYDRNDWCTPLWLFNKLQEVFEFEIDGASDGTNNLLPIFNTKDTPPSIVRQREETKRVFINPPFNSLKSFIGWTHPNNLKCLLIPFRPETKLWHTNIWSYATIFVFNKRIQYIHPVTKKEVKGAAFPSCLIFYGNLQPYDLTKLNDLGIFIKKTLDFSF